MPLERFVRPTASSISKLLSADAARSAMLEDGPKETTHEPQRGQARHERNAHDLEVAGHDCTQNLSTHAAPNAHPTRPSAPLAGVAHLLREHFEHLLSELTTKRGRVEKKKGGIDPAVHADRWRHTIHAPSSSRSLCSSASRTTASILPTSALKTSLPVRVRR